MPAGAKKPLDKTAVAALSAMIFATLTRHPVSKLPPQGGWHILHGKMAQNEVDETPCHISGNMAIHPVFGDQSTMPIGRAGRTS